MAIGFIELIIAVVVLIAIAIGVFVLLSSGKKDE